MYVHTRTRTHTHTHTTFCIAGSPFSKILYPPLYIMVSKSVRLDRPTTSTFTTIITALVAIKASITTFETAIAIYDRTFRTHKWNQNEPSSSSVVSHVTILLYLQNNSTTRQIMGVRSLQEGGRGGGGGGML